MGQRLELQTTLEDILGSSNVYFQPPANIEMKYPCIVYLRDGRQSRFADNHNYSKLKRYQVTIIDRDPDSLVPDRVAELPLCVFTRFFTAENLNHDVYDLYF
jgi:hypothetical protein